MSHEEESCRSTCLQWKRWRKMSWYLVMAFFESTSESGIPIERLSQVGTTKCPCTGECATREHSLGAGAVRHCLIVHFFVNSHSADDELLVPLASFKHGLKFGSLP